MIEYLTDSECDKVIECVDEASMWSDIKPLMKEKTGDKLFTNDQMVRLFSDVINHTLDTVDALLSRPELTSHHIDLVLEHGSFKDCVCVFRTCRHLTPEQIEYGIHEGFRDVVKRHDCTDAQKVKYHLKYG